MASNWMNKEASLYETHADNIGRPASYRDILLSQFAKDLPLLLSLRKLNIFSPDYKTQAKPFKAKLQCFTPAALMATKAAGQSIVKKLTGIMQLDFDYNDIKDYDLEELKQCVFGLPFIGFCGLSCSGKGFYALALVAEPEKLSQYAEHCFEVLKEVGIKPDESKGKKPENLRYLSYDANMLIRENPEPLHVKQFKTKQAPANKSAYKLPAKKKESSSASLNKAIHELQNVQQGERWATVQKWAYTVGGLNELNHLSEISNAILSNPAFNGEHEKYLKCANDCFRAGSANPLSN